MRRCDRSSDGFTLIELLVVVAIISILAGILFPVFAHARERARQSNCLSNARQIGQAIMMYGDSFDQAYPLYRLGPNQGMWYEVIEPYLKNHQIFRCPALPRQDGNPSGISPMSGYGVNYLHVIMYGPEPGVNPKDAGPQFLGYLPRPSATIMLADAQVEKGQNAGMGWPAIYCPCHYPNGPTWYTDIGLDKTWALSDRHGGGGNYVFADGHVRWMHRNTVINSSREPGEELWGHYRK